MVASVPKRRTESGARVEGGGAGFRGSSEGRGRLEGEEGAARLLVSEEVEVVVVGKSFRSTTDRPIVSEGVTMPFETSVVRGALGVMKGRSGCLPRAFACRIVLSVAARSSSAPLEERSERYSSSCDAVRFLLAPPGLVVGVLAAALRWTVGSSSSSSPEVVSSKPSGRTNGSSPPPREVDAAANGLLELAAAGGRPSLSTGGVCCFAFWAAMLSWIVVCLFSLRPLVMRYSLSLILASSTKMNISQEFSFLYPLGHP